MSTALLASRPTPIAARLGTALATRGFSPVVSDPASLHAADDPLPDLRLAVWLAPDGVRAAEEVFAQPAWEAAVTDQLEGAFRVLRAAAAGMHRLDPVDGERGLVVLVATREATASLAHETALDALAGMTFAAARDLADLAIRVMAVVREPDEEEGAVALILQALENPMLNGQTVRARGRPPGGW